MARTGPGRDTVEAGWETVVFVCGKCSKRQKGGFGPKGKTGLAKALRKLLPKGKARRQPYGVVEVRCLGLCPRDAVVAIDGRQPGRWHLVAPGTPVVDVAARLGIGQPAPPAPATPPGLPPEPSA